jgi:hypothetical protein
LLGDCSVFSVLSWPESVVDAQKNIPNATCLAELREVIFRLKQSIDTTTNWIWRLENPLSLACASSLSPVELCRS